MPYPPPQYGAHREDDPWLHIRTIGNQTRSLRCYEGAPGHQVCADLLLFSKGDISCFSCPDQLLTFQVCCGYNWALLLWCI